MIPSSSLEEWLRHPNHSFAPCRYYLPAVLQSYKMPNEHKHKNLPCWSGVCRTEVRTLMANKEQNNFLAVDMYVLWLNQGISSYLPMRNLWLRCSWSVLEINNRAQLSICVQLLPPAACHGNFLHCDCMFPCIWHRVSDDVNKWARCRESNRLTGSHRGATSLD